MIFVHRTKILALALEIIALRIQEFFIWSDFIGTRRLELPTYIITEEILFSDENTTWLQHDILLS